MGDSSKTQTSHFYNILGIPKSASLSEICKAYKSLVKKWHPDRHHSDKSEAHEKFCSINEAYRTLSLKKREEAAANLKKKEEGHGDRKPKHKKKKSQENEKSKTMEISQPTLISRTMSTNVEMTPVSCPKAPSRRCTTPIFFSQSAARVKPPPIERKIECSLEELFIGCVKKIRITREAISTSGLIVEEEEILIIQVQPGWKEGTKITFEGKGDERPGTLPADIVFSVEEKIHPLYKRDGNDLELGVELPLVQALTGCTIPVPLLGGGEMSLSLDDIIYPGYETIIPGEGMLISEQGGRGDMRLKFLVEFPVELTNDQRMQIVNILE